ncbi:hypothetical protein [Chitinophaga sp. HK235]|uniref:hypothetical protein n=1 Tax=Chitinophaga sp. HK235 TaxID=2952571 RepID=UPI001BA5A78F|nr:hypothetical protein [Chitinophaga sp. HK235]
MDAKSRQFFLSYILENRITDVVKINNDCLHLLGTELPIKVNETGSIVSIRNSQLDQPLSARLTYELWSLSYLNACLMHAREDGSGIILQLRINAIELLVETLAQLEDEITGNDIIAIIEDVANGRMSIKNELSKVAH